MPTRYTGRTRGQGSSRPDALTERAVEATLGDMGRRSGSGSSSSLRDTVAQRGRQIAEAARLRGVELPEADTSAVEPEAAAPHQARRRYTPRAPVPAWLRLVVELLPATTKQQVRDILREPAPEPTTCD